MRIPTTLFTLTHPLFTHVPPSVLATSLALCMAKGFQTAFGMRGATEKLLSSGKTVHPWHAL